MFSMRHGWGLRKSVLTDELGSDSVAINTAKCELALLSFLSKSSWFAYFLVSQPSGLGGTIGLKMIKSIKTKGDQV